MSNNVFLFKPKSELNAEQNLRAFIVRCENELTAFGVDCWNTGSWKAQYGARTVTVRFATNTKPFSSYDFEQLSSPFVDFAKAYIRYTYSLRPISQLQRHIEALRVLEEALLETNGEADILFLDGLVLDSLITVFSKRILSIGGRNKVGYQLERIFDFCRENLITPSLPEWSNPFARVKDLTISLDDRGKEYRSDKLPSDEEMMLVASLFNDAPSLGVEAEYYTAIMAILMTAPSRSSELTTLPVNCLEWEEDSIGRKRLGIRWVPAKKGAEGLKWVPQVMESVVVEAIDRLKRIGKEAREAARFAEANPNVFMRHKGCITIPMHGEKDQLTKEQFSAAMAVNIRSLIPKPPTTKWLIDILESNNGEVNYQILGEHEYKKYSSKFNKWPYVDKASKVKVSEALLLHRENEFHAKFKPRGYSFCLPNVNQINDRFVQKDTRDGFSLWSKHGIRKGDGQPIRIPSHNARHWLSTKAERGGMDELTLANWAGRARVSDNEKYDHRTDHEKSDEARAFLIPEDASILKKIEIKSPVTFEDIGRDIIGVALVTELGVCKHDFAMMPCQRGGDCETCKKMVCIKGFSSSLELLKKRESEISETFDRAVSNHEIGTFGADRWVSSIGWRLSHIRTKIRMLEDENILDGTPLHIPEQFDPSPIKNVLLEKGMEAELLKPETVELDDAISALMTL